MTATEPTTKSGLKVGGYILLASLAGLSPLTSVFILPALPDLALDLQISTAEAQLALSVAFAGLAVGLLIVGPLSDRHGRRYPLLAGLVLYIITTLMCAWAPDFTTLFVCRLLQGISGGAVWVIARAVIRDVFSARASARAFSQMSMITGLAPIAAPVLAGQLLAFMDWRGLFYSLAGFGSVVMLMALLFMRETLPKELRHQGGMRSQSRVMAGLLRSRYLLAFIVLGIVQSAMYFTFVIMSPFVFSGEFGLNSQTFGAMFAAGAGAMALGNQLNVLLLKRWRPDTLLRVQLSIALIGSAAFFVAMLVDAPLAVVAGVLLIVPLSSGASNANITALGLGPFGYAAGSAAAVLGACQFGIGALVPPLASLIGLGGLTMGVTMTVTAVGALVIALIVQAKLGPAITAMLKSGD